MFYIFYLNSTCNSDFNQVKNLIKDITPIVSLDKLDGRQQISEETEDTFKIWCEFFSLRVNNGGQHVKFRSEDYNMKFQYQFWFDVYTVTPNWLECMLAFVGKLMKTYNEDCVLEANGDTPIVMRRNNVITIDDAKLNGFQRFPFHYLELDYQEGEIL